MVVADVNGDGARAVAEEIGGVGVDCDVAREEDVVRAIAAAGEPVDVFCANAGVADMSTEQTPDDQWDLVLGVNIRAHVIAARRLVPGWLERGSGCFAAYGVSGGAADADRFGHLCGHQARGRGIRRMAVGDVRGSRHPRELPLPAWA